MSHFICFSRLQKMFYASSSGPKSNDSKIIDLFLNAASQYKAKKALATEYLKREKSKDNILFEGIHLRHSQAASATLKALNELDPVLAGKLQFAFSFYFKIMILVKAKNTIERLSDFKVGSTYSAYDLHPTRDARYKRHPFAAIEAPSKDPFSKIGYTPINEHKNAHLLSNYLTPTGKIIGAKFTGKVVDSPALICRTRSTKPSENYKSYKTSAKHVHHSLFMPNKFGFSATAFSHNAGTKQGIFCSINIIVLIRSKKLITSRI